MKLTLEKHNSPDRGTEYYYIVVDNFTIYSTFDLVKAEERYKHIKEVGIAAYLEEIKIVKTILIEEDITPTDDSKHYDNMTGHEIKSNE